MAATKYEKALTRRKLLAGLGASSALGAAFVARPDMAVAGAQTLAEFCGLVPPGQANIGTASHATPGEGAAPDGSFHSWNDPQAWPDGKVPGPHDKAVVAKHIVASGDITVGAIEIQQGGLLRYEPNTPTTIQSRGNVVVAGCLTMRPSSHAVVHTLRFIEVDESKYVGGGMEVLDSDVGLWVTGAGLLDAIGTPRRGWNRTGDDSSWLPTDELIVAPNARGDLTGFKPFTKGSAVPSVQGPDGVTYFTEVANLTRNVRIEGTPTGRAHVMFLHCHRPQTIKFVDFRYMGPQQPSGDTYRRDGTRHDVYAGVLGRYGLHFHHCGDGSRGSLMEGVVVRNTGHRAFVPHMSHGITFRDCIAHDVRESAFWWDAGDETHDVLLESCAVLGVPANDGDSGLGLSGILHGLGLGNIARNCVVAGVMNNRVNSGGYLWPSSANHGNNVWEWHDNVAHNNREAGVGTWQNDQNPHLVDRFVSYRNGAGIGHGAYVNKYAYRDGVTFENGMELVQHAIGELRFERVLFGGDVHIQRHALATNAPSRYVDCSILGSVVVDESGGEAGVIRFESSKQATDMVKEKFQPHTVLSSIVVANSSGSSYVVT